jgi:predicted nucleic acid-binding protein
MPEGPVLPLFFDTVTLSNFALADRVDLLVSRYGRRAQVTPEVLDEISEGVAAGHSALRRVEDAVASGRLGVAPVPAPPERDTYRYLLGALSTGEASCVAQAERHNGTVVTDDRAARTRCAERGIRCTGTVGILKACVLDATLSAEAADAILQSMIDAGFHAPVRRISDLL